MKWLCRSALALLLALALAVPALALGPQASDVYYAQLSDDARGIYDAMTRASSESCA